MLRRIITIYYVRYDDIFLLYWLQYLFLVYPVTSFGGVLAFFGPLLFCALLFDRHVVYSADLTSNSSEVDVKLLYGANCL